jgi:ComF family protein
MLDFVLNILFPPACSVCGKIDKNWLCPKCKTRVERLEKSCIVDIEKKKYEKLLYIFKYESLIRKLILRYKFSNKAYLNHFFANVISQNEKNCKLLKQYDLIIPVPMHKKKMKKRGYNQTELVANELEKNLNIPARNDILSKVINTTTQSKLGGKARQSNIQHAFFIKNDIEVEDKKIILLDDIYTTGATSEECSRVLKEAGAREVLVLVLAKD